MVAHPSEWEFGGYTEAPADRERSSITDFGALLELLGADSIEALQTLRSKWVEEPLANGNLVREGKWTGSVAVGSKGFVETVKAKLGSRAKGRRVSGAKNDFALREPQELFGGGLDE